MKRTLIPIFLIAFTAAAFAAPGPRPNRNEGPGRRPPGMPAQQLAKFLDLSDAQQSEAKALHETLRQTIEPLREQLESNRDAIRSAVEAGNAEQAGSLMIAGRAVREQIRAAHQDFDAKFEAILNADQKAKWTVLKELRESRRDGRGREERE